MSFPRELDYARQKPASVSSRPVIQRFRADLQSYAPTQVIRIEIPTAARTTHLFPSDCFLEGQLVVTTANTTGRLCLDGNVYSLFRRLSVYHGSNLLETQYYCGKLWHVLNDCQRGWSDRAQDSVAMLNDSTPLVGPLLGGTNGSNGVYFASLNGVTIPHNATTTYDFSFMLPSAIFGSMAGKAIPLGACSASSFYIELELETTSNMVALTANPDAGGGVFPDLSGTIALVNNVVFNAKVAVLPDDVNNILMNSVMNRIIIPSTSWKVELKTLASGASSFNDKFAFQLSSVNAFLFWMHNDAAQNSYPHRSMTSRPSHKVQNYQLNINGETYPSDLINSRSRMICELQRAFDSLGSTKSGCGILDRFLFRDTALDTSAASTATEDLGLLATGHVRCVYGVDLNRFNNSQETMLSGTSTIGQSVNLIINKTGVAQAAQIYGAVMHDVIYTVQDGLMTANT
jgi:hypothetical protein